MPNHGDWQFQIYTDGLTGHTPGGGPHRARATRRSSQTGSGDS